MKVFTTLFYLLFSWSVVYAAPKAPDLIPKPLSFQALKGHFVISNETSYRTDTHLSENAIAYLQEHLSHNSLYTLHASQQQNEDQLTYLLDATLNDEAYKLYINSRGITLRAGTASGFFYATVTLMQLMDAEIWSVQSEKESKTSWRLPACEIEDAPHFKWRGMMLDSSRNFFSVSYVKKFIDRMAQYKLNLFHWHLSDDEGWRVEIKQYPRLTEVGSKRGPGTQLPFSFYPAMRGPKDKMQAGFYAQEEIKEIVAYAAKRSINILPEIDIPAHAKAAVTAYPKLLQDPKDTSRYRSVQKISNNTIDPGLPSSYLFLDNVIGELTTLFPFEYIHLGGDEVPKKAWEGSPSVQRLMKKEHLQNNSEVERYFFKRMDAILKKHHRKMVAWQEVFRDHNGLRKGTIIMAWRGNGALQKAVKNDVKVVAAPAQFLYFDQQYLKQKGEYGHTWAGPTDTKEVYSYKPLQHVHTNNTASSLQGVQACLWSERAFNEKIADYLVWPRALALSEVAWSAQNTRNWKNFKKRMARGGLQRLRVQKIHYRLPHP